MQKKSYLISFEGIEGCGKSSQIQEFKKYLEDTARIVTVLREPGATRFGEHIRSALLSSTVDLDPIAQAFAFSAARAQLIKEKINPLLQEPNNVLILDRYIDSTYAYQGHAQGLNTKILDDIHSLPPLCSAVPDITFYLKIDYKTSLARQNQRGETKDYFESKDSSFYTKLIEGFDIQAKKFPERIKIIEAQNEIKSVTSSIIKTWEESING